MKLSESIGCELNIFCSPICFNVASTVNWVKFADMDLKFGAAVAESRSHI